MDNLEDSPNFGARIDSVCRRSFLALSLLVLALAAFNLTYRLNQETVTEWDESLYATSAAEMVQSGNWTATTFLGEIDYYNTKPPLNVWLIAASFKAFGLNLWSLRLPSVLAALFTVVLLLIWTRHAYSPTLAIGAGLVMATSFSFYYVHSGRTANPDALFSLLTLTTIVALWLIERRPAAVLVLALAVAAAFLLKGTGALLLVAVAAVVRWDQPRAVSTPLRLAAGVLFALPVGAWVAARWSIDGGRFFNGLVGYDLVARSFQPLEGHGGSVFYYLDAMQKYQYEWIIAGAAAWLLYPASRAGVGSWLHGRQWATASSLTARAGSMLLLVPTAMRTKAAWYGLPLLPYLSLAVAACCVRSLRLSLPGRRRLVLVMLIVVAALASETRLLWHSHTNRDLAHSDQGLMMEHNRELAGHRLFRARWTSADRFVAAHIVGSTVDMAPGVKQFLEAAQPGDYWLTSTALSAPPLSFVGANLRYALYRK